jgi:DNA-binding ferritin-like protein (Dps family)
MKISKDQLKKINNYIEIGKSSSDWYKNSYEGIKEIFGSDTDLFCNLLSIFSINTTVKINVSLALRAYKEIKKYNYLSSDFKSLDITIKKANEYLKKGSFEGEKIRNFAENLTGNFFAVTVDRWILRAYGFNSMTKKRYSFIESHIKELAKKYNTFPANIQAQIWHGVKIKEGKKTGQKDYRDFLYYLEQYTDKNYTLFPIDLKKYLAA